ncbi:hypothetical protein QN219_28930 [Sinorhizobium sp. 7-81]|nr:hypothetical protein [Sinorhizobium sp. 8-89]MDK1494011.1 hypothetical protein [Sinorhizobium sp. 8-89]
MSIVDAITKNYRNGDNHSEQHGRIVDDFEVANDRGAEHYCQQSAV